MLALPVLPSAFHVREAALLFCEARLRFAEEPGVIRLTAVTVDVESRGRIVKAKEGPRLLLLHLAFVLEQDADIDLPAMAHRNSSGFKDIPLWDITSSADPDSSELRKDDVIPLDADVTFHTACSIRAPGLLRLESRKAGLRSFEEVLKGRIQMTKALLQRDAVAGLQKREQLFQPNEFGCAFAVRHRFTKETVAVDAKRQKVVVYESGAAESLRDQAHLPLIWIHAVLECGIHDCMIAHVLP